MEKTLGGSRSRHLPAVCLTRRAHRYCTKFLLPACLLALVIALGCASPTSSTTLCHYYVLLPPHRSYPSPTPKSPTIILPFLLRLLRQTEALILFLIHPSTPALLSPFLSLCLSSLAGTSRPRPMCAFLKGIEALISKPADSIPTSDVNPQRHARPGIPPSSLQAFPTVIGQKAPGVMLRLHFLWLAQTGK